MTRRLFKFLALATIVSAGLAATVASAQIQETKPNPATLSIEVGAATATPEHVPTTLFGSFLEPIGDSINQGLSAELIVNGSLEDGLWSYGNVQRMVAEQPQIATSNNSTGLPYPWLPLHPAAARRFALHHGDAANSWQYVEIMGFPAPSAGIMQSVYPPVQRTLSYKASLYVRHLSGASHVTIMLKKPGSDDALAQATVDATQREWTKYSTTLTLKRGDVQPLQAADFAIAVEPDERIDVDEISLQPADAVDGLDPDVVAMAKAMHTTVLRFGGNFTSVYDWREGIGPPDKRISEQNIAWGIPEYNKFGTDEFLAFCKMIGAVPQVDLNLGSGTPEEAADWVRYVRAHYPNKVIYELGNELWGKGQVGQVPLDQIAARTVAFSRAVRAVEPDAELMATGERPQSFKEWNAALLTTPPGTFNFLSTHFIRVTNHVQLPNASPDFMASAAYALPVALGRDLHQMQDQLDAVPALRGKVHFAMDEWLFNSRGEGNRVFTDMAPSSKNEGGGLMVAGVFNTLVRNSRIVPISDMTGLMEFAGIWKERGQVYGTPAYYVFRLYTAIDGDTILPVNADSGTYDVRGAVEGFTDMKDIPYVDVIAAMSPDNKQLTLFCINRDLSADLPVQFNLGAFRAGPEANVEQLKASSRYQVNSAEHPENVVPQASTLSIPQAGPVLYTLPHESITRIVFSAP